jgi:hypothetical protein
MPTDLAAVYAQKRRAQAQTQADAELVLIFVLIGLLSSLVLLYADESFARATIELMTLY